MPDPRHVQNFIANAFSISTFRRMVRPGVLNGIRSFLKKIDLEKLNAKPSSSYALFLDKKTKEMQKELDIDWGVARKCLNLFFRDALYNHYLRSRYGLKKFEPFLEIPLDNFSGRELKKADNALPRWRTVKGLTPIESAKFQAAAVQIARRSRTHRVHLDILYWRGGI